MVDRWLINQVTGSIHWLFFHLFADVDTDDLEGADAGSVEEESIEFLIKVEEIPVE